MINSIRSNWVKKKLDISVEPIAFAVFFYLTIYRIIFGGGWVNLASSTFQKVFLECTLWALDVALFLWIASQKKNLSELIIAIRKNWILLGFILYATCSVFWSNFLVVSLYKIFVLIVCSMIAAYIGIAYPIKIVVRKLSWFIGIVVGQSYILAILIPTVGLHTQLPHIGAWRGLFFAKNYMGTFMAFGSTVFLFDLFGEKSKIKLLIKTFLYLLTLGLVFLSRSATAIILLLSLNGGFLLALAWVKWKHKLSNRHYLIIGVLVICITILFITNLDFAFRLLNRSSTLTGRLPLWSYLINNGITNNALFGSGLGAAWVDSVFRLSTQTAIGWSYAPIVSDNGLVDIFLNLGVLGVFLLIVIFLLSLTRVVSYAIKEKNIIGFFPVITIIFLLIVNISLSVILELESFGWFLLVFVLFATTIITTHYSKKLENS